MQIVRGKTQNHSAITPNTKTKQRPHSQTPYVQLTSAHRAQKWASGDSCALNGTLKLAQSKHKMHAFSDTLRAKWSSHSYKLKQHHSS